MGVIITTSTIPGGKTPCCNNCGVALCWDISHHEYIEDKEFWDGWTCKWCNPEYEGSLKRFKEQKQITGQMGGGE